jgi:hypothetical protein
VAVRTRYLFAAVLGLCAAQAASAQEPGRLGLDRGAPMPARPSTANQQLANAVAVQLKQGGQLRNYRIELACRAGVVEVTGEVANRAQCDEALRLIQGVPGVDRVINRLSLAHSDVVRVQADKPAVLPEAGTSASEVKAAAPATDPIPITPTQPGGPLGATDLNPPKMPPFAWPTYAPYPNFSRVGYPEAYPYNAFPYIGPIYPFPKVPLGWRSIKLEFDEGYWWFSRTANKHDWWRLKVW